jgi:hypothetical protein
MKNKVMFIGLLAMLAFGMCLIGCATTDPNAPPPYNFDGTSWVKTETYELSLTASNWTVKCDGKAIAGGQYTTDVWKVAGSTLTFGGADWRNNWGHGAGIWTLKSGTPGTANLDGTVWTRTANLTLKFADGKMFTTDGDYQTMANKDGDAYKNTAKNISVTYSDGTARGTYKVDGNTLTVTYTGTFAGTRLEGSPWTKQ